MLTIQTKSTALSTFSLQIRKRFVGLLVVSLLVLFVSPMTSAEAEGNTSRNIVDLEIEGVTPPVPGAIPVQSITESNEYTGTVAWESQLGPHEGNFRSETIYVATITLNLFSDYNFTGVEENSFIVPGAFRTLNEAESGVITAVFYPALNGATQKLDNSFDGDGSVKILDIFGSYPYKETGISVGAPEIARIAVDSRGRIVVLAKYFDEDAGGDRLILFRLNSNGSYDFKFGDPDHTLRKNLLDEPMPYVLLTTTCQDYTTLQDLEIDSHDRIVVSFSGYIEDDSIDSEDVLCVDETDEPVFHDFIAKLTDVGDLDTEFGDTGEGVVGSLSPQSGTWFQRYADIALDDLDRILVGYFVDIPGNLMISRLLPDGLLDEDNFGAGGNSILSITPPALDPDNPYDIEAIIYESLSVTPINSNGYIVAYSAAGGLESSQIPFTQLFRLDENGFTNVDFVLPEPLGAQDDKFIFPLFFISDLVPSGDDKFVISGTILPLTDSIPFYGIILRFLENGSLDTDFTGPLGYRESIPTYSFGCEHSALLKKQMVYQTSGSVMSTSSCGEDGGRLKRFSSTGSFQGEFSLAETADPEEQIINQLISSNEGRVITLSGVEPKVGLLRYNGAGGLSDWSAETMTITRYIFNDPITPPTPPVVVYIPPTPIPYLTTLTTPKLNLIADKLVCTPGTYNAGYTLDGVIQGSATALFSPTSFTYNLLVNGVTENSLAVTSSNSTNAWNLPAATSGTIFTCAVTVNLNTLTNTDRSNSNSALVSAALSTQATTIATANSDYSASLSTNTKAYQETLSDNRTAWRSSVANNRATYLSELNRINASSPSKETRAQKSAALKIYMSAQKQIVADYKASQPAALTAREAANKAALDAKSVAIAKANAAYGTFIESIGYGVLIP